MTGSGKATVTLPTDEQILITREFDAPRHLVWKAWTEPEQLSRWWGKRGWTTPVETIIRAAAAAGLASAFDRLEEHLQTTTTNRSDL